MRDIDGVKLGTLKKILCVFQGGKTHGYELAKKTGISLGTIYRLLKALKGIGWIEECGWDGVCDDRKYFVLTTEGKLAAQFLEQLPDEDRGQEFSERRGPSDRVN